MDCTLFLDYPDALTYCIEFQRLTENASFQEYGVFGLFLNALLSATAVPIPTEIITSALLNGGESEWIIIGVLVAGSSIGGLLNYGIGFGGRKLAKKIKSVFRQKHIEKSKDKDQKKAHKILGKFGWAAIFFASWIPVVGDLILISAGTKRFNFKKYLVLMISGKTFKAVATVFGLSLVF